MVWMPCASSQQGCHTGVFTGEDRAKRLAGVMQNDCGVCGLTGEEVEDYL
jgi:hypothetical protein